MISRRSTIELKGDHHAYNDPYEKPKSIYYRIERSVYCLSLGQGSSRSIYCRSTIELKVDKRSQFCNFSHTKSIYYRIERSNQRAPQSIVENLSIYYRIERKCLAKCLSKTREGGRSTIELKVFITFLVFTLTTLGRSTIELKGLLQIWSTHVSLQSIYYRIESFSGLYCLAVLSPWSIYYRIESHQHHHLRHRLLLSIYYRIESEKTCCKRHINEDQGRSTIELKAL